MDADDVRRRNGSRQVNTRAGIARWASQLVGEIRGAIEDHRKWITSDRARALETAFKFAGRFYAYAVYLALAYWAFGSVVEIRDGIITGHYVYHVHSEGTRVALFNILIIGLVGPIALIAAGFGAGWVYNLTTAAANHAIPRFVRPLVHPSILFVVVTALAAFNPAVTATLARGYLFVKANVDAATPQETVAIKVIELPVPDNQGIPEVNVLEPTSERELVQLRSMFANRPCPNDANLTALNPEQEIVRPEPGLAQRSDCLPVKLSTPE